MSTAALSHLMGASSAHVVERAFSLVFLERNEREKASIPYLKEQLNISDAEATACASAMALCIRTALYHDSLEPLAELLSEPGSSQPAATAAPTGGDAAGEASLDTRLQQLVGRTIRSNLAGWRAASIQQRCGLPPLLDFDWRIDVKMASKELERMAIPTLLVDMEVQRQPTLVDSVPGVQHVNFELSREALQTMLDGLGRIRDQLGAVSS